MLTTMGLNTQQADTILSIFCTDETISDSVRSQIIALYIDCIKLKPFANNNTNIPLNNNSNIYKTTLSEKILQFYNCINTCLPLSNDNSDLEESLSEILSRSRNEEFKSHLLDASGLERNTYLQTLNLG